MIVLVDFSLRVKLVKSKEITNPEMKNKKMSFVETWFRISSLTSFCIGSTFLLCSIHTYWMSDKQSFLLLFQVVFTAFTFGSQWKYLCVFLHHDETQTKELHMRSMFYPLTHLYLYSFTWIGNVFFILCIKYDIHLWNTILNDVYDKNNINIVVSTSCLCVLCFIAYISTNLHYKNSYGYQKFKRDSEEFEKSEKNQFYVQDGYYLENKSIQNAAPPFNPEAPPYF